MANEVCGKDATEIKVGVGDRKDVPICPECKEAAIAIAVSLNHEAEFKPIPEKAQPIDRLCQVAIGRK